MVAVSGQVPSSVRGRGAFQDLDLSSVFADVAVSTQVVLAGSDHAELAALAVKRAIDGRGVAHLVLPDEVQVLPSEQPAGGPAGRFTARRILPDDDVARRGRPRWCATPAGRCSSSATARARRGTQVRALAERLGAPVLTTFKAKGLIPDTHPLGAGVLGRSGTPVASWLMNESDLLVVVGASFSNHTGIAAYKPIVQIDDAHTAIGRFDAVTEHLLGDAALTVAALDAPGRRGQGRGPARRRRRSGGRSGGPRRRAGSPTTAARACRRRRCSTRWPGTCRQDAVVTVDVGNHAYSLGRYLESAGQPVLMSGYLGSIGFGYPAALGAWAAAPGRPILAVTGDGGFGQYSAELLTAVKYGIPIKHLLLDNHSLGKISKEQLAAGLPVWHTSLHNPDWAEYARLCGATGIRVDRRDQLDDALAELFAADGPALLCVQQDAQLL